MPAIRATTGATAQLVLPAHTRTRRGAPFARTVRRLRPRLRWQAKMRMNVNVMSGIRATARRIAQLALPEVSKRLTDQPHAPDVIPDIFQQYLQYRPIAHRAQETHTARVITRFAWPVLRMLSQGA